MIHPADPSISYAWQLDSEDPLARFKADFCFPQHNDQDSVYFCGNSLGLQPRNGEAEMRRAFLSWKELAVGGFFGGKEPWLHYHEGFLEPLASIVGANKEEVTVMNGLTINLHLLMETFYRPTQKRRKILMEACAFPSDQYAMASQVARHGLDPKECIIEIKPSGDSKTLTTEEITQAITDCGDELAMVLMGGINYYTGQFFDIKTITAATQAAGAVSAWDLAHAAGNVPLSLHDWNVDFAVWCSYKYLNGGPGAVGGAFIHERHATNTSLPRLTGWWGNEEGERFKMGKQFVPKPNASGWNVSTISVLNSVGLKASLKLFEQTDMATIRAKSIALTNYLEMLIKTLDNIEFDIITPEDPAQRGAQLSLFFKEHGKMIHDQLTKKGVVVDYREPGVIRVAPAPLYCSFEDVHRFYEVIKLTRP